MLRESGADSPADAIANMLSLVTSGMCSPIHDVVSFAFAVKLDDVMCIKNFGNEGITSP
jgi:hypothetical protein